MSITEAMANLYDSDGIGNGGNLSWADIGGRYGMSGNAARKRVKRYKKTQQKETPDNARWEQRGKNEAIGEATFNFFAGIDDLVERLGVDTKVWEVERWGYSSKVQDWEGYGKIEQKNLHYVDGVVSGNVSSEGLQKIPLHGESCKIWATFVRIEPIQIFPAIQPIVAAHKFEKPKAPSGDGIITELDFSDPQMGFHRSTRTANLVPFHCRVTLDCIFQIAVYFGVDIVRLLGDGLDLPEWTDKFLKDPQFYWSTQPSLEEMHWKLARFRTALPKARLIYHQGNHDIRLENAIITHLPAAYGLHQAGHGDKTVWPALSIPYLLDFDGLGVEYVENYPSDVDRLNSGGVIRHGEKIGKDLSRDATITEVVAHTHRLKMTSCTRWGADGPRVVYVYEIGCTCRGGGETPGSKWGDQWQKGCSITRYNPNGDMVDVKLIPIENGRALVDGREFIGKDYTSQLRKALPGWNW